MSKKTNIGGKVPMSLKEELESSDLNSDDLDFNVLKVDSELKAELEKQGLVHRWINAKKYFDGGNFHSSGWRAYRREMGSERGATDFNLGVSPEGYIVRNDLILAVKTKEMQEKWSKRIAMRTKVQSGAINNRGEELKEMAQKAGTKAKIYEGYDENNTDD